MRNVDNIVRRSLSTEDRRSAGVRPRRPSSWPIALLALPAFVAIWSGWVGLGKMTGFGPMTLFPGISDFTIDTSITLPIGMETYAAIAIRVWLSSTSGRVRKFARKSALASLALGSLGQIGYHLMAAAHWTVAPWPVTIVVSCIPVAVLGMGAALYHLVRSEATPDGDDTKLEAPEGLPEVAELYEPLPEAPVSPAPAPERAPEEWVALAQQVKDETGFSWEKVGSMIGRSARQLQEDRKKVERNAHAADFE